MTRHFLIAILATLLLASCSPSAKEKATVIDKLEAELKESSQKNIADTAKVKVLLSDYSAYIKSFPTDSLTPIYLMKSAKFYDLILLRDSAIYCYNEVYTKFPGYPKAHLALFSEAFIYANEKHDLAKAETLYKEYMTKFPKTKLAASAALELHNLGKTPDQIMAEMDSLRQLRKDSTMAKH